MTTHYNPDGSPRRVRCYDNKGETADRYTVVFTGRYRRATGGWTMFMHMSGAPFHPQGVCMTVSASSTPDVDRSGFAPALGRRAPGNMGRRVPWSALPADCQRAAMESYKDLWPAGEREAQKS